jgi:pimeloyl-ACP methyl ester carboxylesterase
MGSHGQHVHPAPDVTIDYFAAGDGPVVALVHGITESRRSWDPLIAPLLAQGYRVIAMDLRGHGGSSRVSPYDLATMAADLGALLAAEGADDALLVGHSLGGAVVSAYAASGPCRAVINVDQPLLLGGFKETLTQLQPMLEGAREAFQGAIDAIFDQMAGPLAGTERWRVDHLREAEQDVVLGVWELVFSASVDELDAIVDGVVGAISVPYLSLHGIDPGPDYAAWLTATLPAATVEVWADQGHYPHLIDQQRFVERVVSFDPAT